MGNAVHLVVTDLDGTLLDHDSYSHEAAQGALSLLEQLRIPVVFATSKTRAEVLALREELGNTDPFIAENGAAVLIPRRYFESMPEGCREHDGYWLREFAPPRSHWGPVLEPLRQSGEAGWLAIDLDSGAVLDAYAAGMAFATATASWILPAPACRGLRR